MGLSLGSVLWPPYGSYSGPTKVSPRHLSSQRIYGTAPVASRRRKCAIPLPKRGMSLWRTQIKDMGEQGR